VGFGDITPVTIQGKVVVSLSILAGVAVIPAQGAALFEALLERQRENEKKQRNKSGRLGAADTGTANETGGTEGGMGRMVLETTQACPSCGAVLHWSTARFCWSCGNELSLLSPSSSRSQQ